MIVTMKRVAGGSKEHPDPTLQLFKDGVPVADSDLNLQISGRPDVKPAIERGIAKAKQLFNVELRPSGRNTWTSEPVAIPTKEAKPQVSKVEPINRKQLKDKLQSRTDIPASAAARMTPEGA